MHQAKFEEDHAAQWQQLQTMLDDLPHARQLSPKRRQDLENLPSLYRQTCSQYSLTLRRRYTSGLAGQLHALILRAHRLVYQNRTQSLHETVLFFRRTFPQRVRQEWRAVLFSLLCFLLPALILGWQCYQDSSFVYSLMPAHQVAELESSFSKPGGRSAQGDALAFGYYIKNNVSIDFRTFAGGLFGGVGTLLVLVYNGVVIGGAGGHLSHAPFAEHYWAFVMGHSALELIAMILSGASGLMLGRALIRPGPYRRLDALRQVAPEALQILLGAALMTALAAVIEAFWSAQPLPLPVKAVFAAVNWIAVPAYLCFFGRDHHAA